MGVVIRAANDSVEVSVVDSGQGITPEFLPHVFERFRQADRGYKRSHGGLGIGLALVKHIVELHEGRVTAASDGPGKGSTFVVHLPTEVRESQVPVRITPDVKLSPFAGHLAAVKVLVVDDDAGALELLTAILKESGAHVVTAQSAERIVRRRRLGPRRFAWEWRLAPWPGHVATVLEKPSVRRRARDARRRGREGIAPRYSSRIQAAVGGARGPQSAASRVRMLTGSVTAARTMSLPPQRTQTRRSCSKVRLRSVRQSSRELEA